MTIRGTDGPNHPTIRHMSVVVRYHDIAATIGAPPVTGPWRPGRASIARLLALYVSEERKPEAEF